MTPRPRVSVLLVSYNRSADLRLSLAALFATGYPSLEIIVVDNASTDDALAVARSFEGVKVIANEGNAGFAVANNQALEVSTGDFVALVNNDAVVDARFLDVLVDFLVAHPDAAGAGGKQYLWNDQNLLGNRANPHFGYSEIAPDSFTPSTVDPPDLVREVSTLSGSAVMVRRAAIDDVGAPFLEPEFFMYYEETDFFARAIAKGWKLWYVPAAECWHRVRAGTAHIPYNYYFHMYRNRVLFATRNYADEDLARLLTRAQRDARNAAAAKPGAGPMSEDQRRGIVDAWKWVKDNQALLADHRRKADRSPRGYGVLTSEIVQRARYHGQTRPEVAALVPRGAKHIVDIGCAGGGLGHILRARRSWVEVRGIEMDREAAERARGVLDDVLVGDAGSDLPATWPRPDCVIFADVLEHLVDPWAVLRLWRERLAPGGSLVVSLPNVLHHSVTGGLLRGRWDYQAEGVLDRTHLRFFTPGTAVELLEGVGFRVERTERVMSPPGKGPLRWALGAWRGTLAREREEGRVRSGHRLLDVNTLQVLLRAQKAAS